MLPAKKDRWIPARVRACAALGFGISLPANDSGKVPVPEFFLAHRHVIMD
jgi:hypothetical protein